MQFIKFFKDISKKNVGIAGGKGASLGEMTQAKLNVPPGFVVLASVFDRFIDETNLKEEIIARLAEVNPEDTNSVDRISNVLRDLIHDTEMPKDIALEILASFKKLGASRVAVRSSATAEDSAIASWAGELESYLNTTKETLLDNVKNCWSSLFTPRAIFYRHEKKLIDAYVSVAVVVQKMVQSDISGIAFTVHPVTEDKNQMIIEAGYGLGEAIVSGQITPDSYVVTKNDMKIFDISIGHQSKKIIKDKKGNKWVNLSEKIGKAQKLSNSQIIKIAKICQKIEKHYKVPQDIEWAVENGKIYVTQSRPITTLK
jgi:pyruvate,water dikinase